ncbi:MAG: HisA/HisF-related TIM barrel protein [Candidatus Eiseniibacteriota bacterium]
MNLYPAIDLLEGKLVRLERGAREAATVYDLAPVEAVRRFAEAGARWLHVVDLNRAFGDGSSNVETVRQVVEEASRKGMRVQVGGGLREPEDLEAVFTCGAARVVLGTVAAVNPGLMVGLLERFGGRVAVAIDVKEREVVVRGWTQSTGRAAAELAGELTRMGVKRIVYTDVGRDGLLGGPDVKGAAALAKATGLSVILSGGVGSLEHVTEAAKAGLDGLVVGKSIYDGRIDVASAIAAAGAQEAT